MVENAKNSYVKYWRSLLVLGYLKSKTTWLREVHGGYLNLVVFDCGEVLNL